MRPYAGTALALTVFCGLASAVDFSPNQVNFGSNGGTGSSNVMNTSDGWRVAVQSGMDWVTITSATTGRGQGSIAFTVAGNPYGSTRNANIILTADGGAQATLGIREEPGVLSISPSSDNVDKNGGRGQNITVSTNGGQALQWTASTGQEWITILPGSTSGIGPGTISWSATANTDSNSRTGYITVVPLDGVGGRTFIVQQQGGGVGPSGSVSLSSSGLNLDASASSGTIQVTATAQSITWTASSNQTWLTVSPSGGTGTSSFTYAATGNPSAQSRSATITVTASQGPVRTLTVVQSGGVLTVTPLLATVGVEGGTGNIALGTTDTALVWRAVSSQGWLTINFATGAGPVTLQWAAGTNISATARSAQITITPDGGSPITFSLSQDGIAPGSFSVSPTIADAPASRSDGSAKVTSAVPSLTWTASSNQTWLQITSGASGTGTGTINYTVEGTTVAATRVGVITVTPAAGTAITITVTQARGFLSVTSPPTATAPGSGGTGSFQIKTSNSTLLWTATVTSPWLTITSTNSGAGDATMTWAAAANATNTPRSAIIIVLPSGGANTIFTITQGALSGTLVSSVTDLTFSYQLEGAPPADKQIIVGSVPPGLPFTASASTTSGGNWLSVSGPVSGVLTVSANPTGLTAGIYNGSIIISSSSATNSPVNVPVTLTVTPVPILIARPSPITFSFQQNGTLPVAQEVVISTSIGTLDYTIVPDANAPWLTATGAGPAPASLTLSVTPGRLDVGVYQANIQLRSVSAGNSPLVIPVSLRVSAAPNLVVTPGSLSLTYRELDPLPDPIILGVLSSSSTVLPFTATTTAPWISTSGANQTPAKLRVSINPTGLSAGIHQASIVLTSDQAGNSPAVITVVLTVLPGHTLTAQPAELTFSLTQGGPALLRQGPIGSSTTSVTVSSDSPIPYTVSQVIPANSWLTVQSSSTSTTSILTVTARVGNLTPGTYPGTIVLTSGEASNSPLTIPVTLTVSMQPQLTTGSDQLSFAYQRLSGLPLLPAQSISVSTVSPGALVVASTSTTSGGPWLIAGNGTTTPGAIHVTANAFGLKAGTYTGSISFTSPGYAPTSVPVTLTVTDAPLLTVAPVSLQFAFQQGDTVPPAQAVAIGSSSNTSPLLFAALTDGSPWLSVTGGGRTPDSISVSVNPTGLAPGFYRAAVAVASTQAGNLVVRIPVTLNVTLSPPVLVQPASLSFSYTQQRPVPAAQSVSVSSGQQLAFSASVLGDQTWLLLKGGGNTPSNLELSVDPTGLTPGQYATSVLINAPTAENNPIEVPVVLTVNPAASINASLGQVVFSYQMGGAPPSNQPLVITSSDTSLVVTGSVSTETGGSWLSITGGGSANPAAFSLSASPAGLQPGIYHGSITFTAPGADNTVTLPVTFVITAAPVLRVSPAQIQLSYQIGATPPSIVSIQVSSSGDALPFQATASTDSGGSWLQVSAGGTTTALLTVTLTPTGLTPGTYTGKIEISSASAGNTPLLVPVTLTVSTNLTLGASPNSLQFSAQLGASQPAPQTVGITSSGTPIGFTYTATPSAGWLSVNATTGPTPANLSVSVSTAGLAAGSYSALILVQSPLAANSPLEIPVNLEVTAAPVLGTAPAVLHFSYVVSGTRPLPQSFSVSSTGTPISYSAVVTPTLPWLFASASGTTPGTVQVAVDPGVLTPGEYQGTIVASSESGTVAPVQVILTVSAAPVLLAQTTEFNFAYQIGGLIPVNQTLIVRCDSGSVDVGITTQVLSGGNWLVVSGGGSTPAPFSLGVNPAGLAPGIYRDQIIVGSPDPTVASLTIPVTLSVTSAPVLVSLPNVLLFAAQTGAAAAPNRQLTITSSDGTPLSVTAQPSFGINWLTVSADSTMTPAVLTVGANPAGLSAGVYSGSLVISSPASDAGSVVVPVSLTIADRPPLTADPSAVSFSTTLSAQPAPMPVTVASGGTPLNFTVAPGPGAPWLSVTGGGTTPSPIVISVDSTGLAAGAYHAAVFITAPGAANSLVAIPVDLLVSSGNLLNAFPSSLSFSRFINPRSVLKISSTVPGVAFSASASAATPWLKVNTTGTTPQDVDVVVDATGLSPGTYQGAIQVSASGVANSPFLIPVTLTVSITPSLIANPTPLRFAYDSSGPLPGPQSVTLALGGAPALGAQAAIAPGTPWLTLQQGTDGTVSVVANPSGLLPGDYTGSVQVAASNASNSPLTIPVSFTVSGFPSFDVSQNAMAFAGLPQQTDPVSSTLTVGGNSNTPFDVEFNVTGSTWLSVSPLSGRTPLNVTVTANPAGLRPGTYAGSISISSAGNLIRTVPVNLTISSGPDISVSPQFLVFNYSHGGNLPDPTNLYFIRFAQNVSIVASTTDSWIALNPTTPTASGPIAVAVNPASLPPGTYVGHVFLTVSDSVTGAQLLQRQIPVELYVDQPTDPRIQTIGNGMNFLATPLAPGLIISIFGSGLGPTPALVGQPEPGSQIFPRSLGGVQVLVNGISCPVLYVSDTQINAIAPYALYTKDAASVAVRHNGVLSTAVSMHVSPTSPGLFSLALGGTGQGAILNQDQSFNTSQNPADKGSIISLFGGGDGQTAPQGIDGLTANDTPYPKPILPVSVFIGGIPATDITYTGAAPTLVGGVLQVNVRIPANAPSGNVPVVIVVGDTSSQQGLTVSIR